MKKIYSTIALLAMMVAALSFTACGGDDDDDDVGDDASIVGVWELVSFDVDSQVEYEEQIIGNRITFKSNGTYSSSSDSGKWSLNGKTLTIISDDNGYPLDYTIKKLTQKELIFDIDFQYFKIEYRCKRVS